MRVGKCAACGREDGDIPKYLLAQVNSTQEHLFCEPCANAELQGAASGAFRVARYIDPTVCSKCKTDYGSMELPRVGGAPFCATCRDSLYARRLPKWLTASVAAMIVLLLAAWGHDTKFFRTEKALILGERLVGKHQYAASIPLLESVVQNAPNCEKCLLLLAKSEMLIGNPATAYKVLQSHKGGNFEKSRLTDEIDVIANRIAGAHEKYKQALELDKKHQWEDAARKLREAANEYPEQIELALAAESMEEGVPFERKDYDAFLEVTEKYWTRGPRTFLRAGSVASALACKYAVTGDTAFRTRAEEMLEKSKQLAITPDDVKVFTEYEERIRYRLKSREIIDTDEYNRRYRPQPAKEKDKG
jgi:tetratricopeptide (TPR) repeat protein